MKTTALFSALALTASIFADGDIAAQMKSDTTNKMTERKPAAPMVVLNSARPDSDNGWYLFADALYWHADVGSTDWARKVDDATVQTPAVPFAGAVHHLDFKWNWGFRVGIGVNMDHDSWDSNFYYTWFRTENSNAASVVQGTGTIVNLVTQQVIDGQPSVSTIAGTNEWKIHYNMFDWELGRWYYVSRNLALRPHVGIKGGWINQDVGYTFSGVNLADPDNPAAIPATADFKNHFWGVGPSSGVNMMWVLGNAGDRQQHRFSLFGDAAGALLYGHFDVKHTESTFDADGALTFGNNLGNLSRNLAVPVLQTQMGFSWDTSFNNDRNHFMFKIGYEFQYWFRQNQQAVYMSQAGDVTAGQFAAYRRASDDLALQGLTGEFRFDF